MTNKDWFIPQTAEDFTALGLPVPEQQKEESRMADKIKPLTKDERDEAMKFWRVYIERHEATIQALESENQALRSRGMSSRAGFGKMTGKWTTIEVHDGLPVIYLTVEIADGIGQLTELTFTDHFQAVRFAAAFNEAMRQVTETKQENARRQVAETEDKT